MYIYIYIYRDRERERERDIHMYHIGKITYVSMTKSDGAGACALVADRWGQH